MGQKLAHLIVISPWPFGMIWAHGIEKLLMLFFESMNSHYISIKLEETIIDR